MKIQGRRKPCKTQTFISKSDISQVGNDISTGEKLNLNENVLYGSELTENRSSKTQTCNKFTNNYEVNYQLRGRVRPGEVCSSLSPTKSYISASHNLSSLLINETNHQLKTSSTSTEEDGHQGSIRNPGVPLKAIENGMNYSEPIDQ